MPLARAKAATASFPTLLEEGSVFLRIRRTQATGGSNSTAEGGPDDDDLLGVVVEVAAAVCDVAVAADGAPLFSAAASAPAAGVLGGMGLLDPFSLVGDDSTPSPPPSPTSILSGASGPLDAAAATELIPVVSSGGYRKVYTTMQYESSAAILSFGWSVAQ